MSMASLRSLVPVLASAVACGLSLTVLGTVETRLREELGLGHGLAGLAQSAFFLGNLVGSFATGSLIRGLRPRSMTGLALGLLSVGNLLSGVRRYPALLVGRLLCGLGVSMTVIQANAVVVGRFPERQGAVLSALHGLIAVAAAGALAASPGLARWGGSYAIGPTLVGLVGLGALLTGLLLMPHGPLVEDPEGRRPRGAARIMARLLGQSRARAVLVLLFGYMISEQGVTTFFSAFLEDETGGSPAMAASMTALFWLALGLGRFVGAPLAMRLPERGLTLGCYLGSLLLLVGLLIVKQGIWAFWGMLLFGLAMGPVIPLCLSRAARFASETEQPVALALANTVGCLGGTLGPLGLGLVGDHLSLRSALRGGAGLGLVCAVPLLLDRPSSALDRGAP